MHLRLQGSFILLMVLNLLLAALDLHCQLDNAHAGIAQLLIHVLYIIGTASEQS